MHIQTSNSKVSAAEKMHMTTKRKGNHEAKKTTMPYMSGVMNQQNLLTLILQSTENNRIQSSVHQIEKLEH